ncbi:unnamed protein product [Lepeophtheirus salmonis]|uniref:(salmon louse) hypothetical protein n=2 Tax=Lepeophtheirus salmonis TaxID=72036 RepID=A0A7R8CV82_LEPSM|nr:unnamed protein product [Lepeophtheirus salmonis]CAF2941186.1 unnamed protein product [Lepeophtheirus salmonis]
MGEWGSGVTTQSFHKMKYLYCLVLACIIPLIQSETVFTHRSSRYNAQSLHSAASSIDERMQGILGQIRSTIPSSISSIESDIAVLNIRKAFIGTMNLFGALFGIRGAIGDNLSPDFTLKQLSFGDQLNALSQAMYGFGYVGPFYLELEEARLDCGLSDFDNALREYAYVTDFSTTYGHSYTGSSDTDPHLLTYYVIKMKHALKRSIYCITSRKGSNQEAVITNSLIDLYAKLATERLSLTDGILSTSNNVENPTYQGASQSQYFFNK